MAMLRANPLTPIGVRFEHLSSTCPLLAMRIHGAEHDDSSSVAHSKLDCGIGMSEDIDAAIAEILADLESAAAKPDPMPEWPDAKALCFHVGASMKNLPAYRQGMAVAGIVDLAYEFAVMDHLVALFGLSDDGVAKLAGPATARLRDICAAEGVRRGVILTAGDDVSAISLAVELMEEMIAAFTPSFSETTLGKQR